MTKARRDRGVTTVEWVIVAMIIGVGCIAVWRMFKDQYMQPTAERMGDCIEAAAGDGDLCGGLATGGASNGGASNSGGGNAAGGALAQNGPGAANGGNGASGGMTAGELANSVGKGGAAGGGAPGEGGENGHAENPHAGLINGIGYGMGLAAAAEDALIDLTKWKSGIELSPAMENAFTAVRIGEVSIIGVPLDLLANGVPHNPADGASLGLKTGIIGGAIYFGGPLGAAIAVGLDKSLGYLSDSITGGTRYQDDWKDSWAYQIVHLSPGTIGKDAELQRQQYEQQMIHEELQYQRQQQQRDEEALREMMKR